MKFRIGINVDANEPADQVRVQLIDYELAGGDDALTTGVQATIERERSVVKGRRYVKDMCNAMKATCSEISGGPTTLKSMFRELILCG